MNDPSNFAALVWVVGILVLAKTLPPLSAVVWPFTTAIAGLKLLGQIFPQFSWVVPLEDRIQALETDVEILYNQLEPAPTPTPTPGS